MHNGIDKTGSFIGSTVVIWIYLKERDKKKKWKLRVVG